MLGSVTILCPEMKEGLPESNQDIEGMQRRTVTKTSSKSNITVRESGEQILWPYFPLFFSSPASDFFGQRPEAIWVSLLGPRAGWDHIRGINRRYTMSPKGQRHQIRTCSKFKPPGIPLILTLCYFHPGGLVFILHRCSWASFVLVFWLFFSFSDSSVSCVESILLF